MKQKDKGSTEQRKVEKQIRKWTGNMRLHLKLSRLQDKRVDPFPTVRVRHGGMIYR